MQDIQNIPNPDVNTTINENDFGTHSEDIERPEKDIPLPPDSPAPAPIEEPPAETERAPVDEDTPEAPRIV